MSYLVGIDVGGTTSTVAIGNENREILYVSDQFDTNSAAGPGPLIHAVVEAILKGGRIARRYRRRHRSRVHRDPLARPRSTACC